MSNEQNEKKISDRELISGRIYSRNPITPEIEEKAEYIKEAVDNYRTSKSPGIEYYEPFTTITLNKTANTIIRPILALRKEDSPNQIDWIVDYAVNSEDVLAYCIKPVVYREAGIQEYWIIDLKNEAIIIYNLAKDGFIQQVIVNPRRIKVGLLNSLLLNYSDIFRKDW